jgi:hypothetical protein
MVINLSSLPHEIIHEFGVLELAHGGRIYVEIQKGMYGLPQAGILAKKLSQRRLALDSYRPTEHTHGLWKHETRPVWFSLVVDDFGINYIGHDNTEHLMASIKKNYDISSDWTGSAYYGLKLDWDYINGTVDLYMPGYIKAALQKYQHPAPTRTEHVPHQWNPCIYGAKTQYVEDIQDIPALSPKEVTHLQQLGGSILYYACTVDPTLIMPVNVLASEQTKSTAATADKIIKLLNYCTTHPEDTLRYHASDMILNIHSDASYLSER